MLLLPLVDEKLFLKSKDEIIEQYLDGIAKEDKKQQEKFLACRVICDLKELFQLDLKIKSTLVSLKENLVSQ